MINLEELRLEIRTMSVRSKLYKLLRDELRAQDHWKNQKRGKPNPNQLWVEVAKKNKSKV